MRYFVRATGQEVCVRRMSNGEVYQLTLSGWVPLDDFDDAYQTVCTGEFTEILDLTRVPCWIARHRMWSTSGNM